RRTLRPGLALDRRARREERAVVARVLGCHSSGERVLRTLEARTGIERRALDTGVQIDATARAAAVGGDREREAIAAARAPEQLVRSHQVRCAWSRRILQRPARRALL